MAQQRRTPRGGPGGSRRPGQRDSPRARSTAPSASSAPAATPPARPIPAAPLAPGRRRPRLTGRAAVLVLVLAVLVVSYASSMRAYLQQREHISDLKSAIAERETSINELEREKRRWQDPAYVEAQARAHFGYLMPGETGFVVLDAKGEPLEANAELSDPDEVVKTEPKAWWDDAWASVELAGHPPKVGKGPAEKIGANE
ncbi:septum formation initiator family protein [Nocardioides sp. InS609-2]|uniref:FtsB family cell division protein n=1 Tax=Nocardioides sp. InS609-2 TaxID=2760705 RepID=UPI0020BEB6BD|nr:septum formation initiator family protein [Nocardioides sp. InS609-2]